MATPLPPQLESHSRAPENYLPTPKIQFLFGFQPLYFSDLKTTYDFRQGWRNDFRGGGDQTFPRPNVTPSKNGKLTGFDPLFFRKGPDFAIMHDFSQIWPEAVPLMTS